MKAASQAYEITSRTTAQGRVAEALAFSKAARLLDEALQAPENRHLLREALRQNRLVWTAVQAEITDEASKLPRRLKAGLMSLSLYVDRLLADAAGNFEPDRLKVLIAIDRDMAAGLMETPPLN